MSKRTVFVAPLNWGLGHATRVLPLIRRFLSDGWEVIVAAGGRSGDLLEKEAPQCTYIPFPMYPIRYPRTRFFLSRFMTVIFPQMMMAIMKEKRALIKLVRERKIDLILSDNRFALYRNEIPSILISHQLRYILPWPVSRMEWLPEYFNSRYFNNYDRIIVPDSDDPGSLTGRLSHAMRYIPREKLYYSGILDSVQVADPKPPEDVDFFIIVSGPEPQRTRFEELIFKQVNALSGKVVVALGQPERDFKIRQGNAVFYTYMNREMISGFMQRARFIIGRPGYTSVMEMVELGKKGMFIPTPGQVEQVELARYYTEMGWCHHVSQFKMNLSQDVTEALRFPGFPDDFSRSAENVDRLFREIFDRI